MAFVHLTLIKRNLDSKVSHINASQTLVHLRMLGRPSLFSPHTPTGDTPRVGFIWSAMGLRIYICIHLPGDADLANPCTTFRKLWLNQKDSLNIKTVWKLKITQSEHWTHSKTPLSCPRWLACFFFLLVFLCSVLHMLDLSSDRLPSGSQYDWKQKASLFFFVLIQQIGKKACPVIMKYKVFCKTCLDQHRSCT